MKDPRASYALMLLIMASITVGALIYGLSPTGYTVLDTAKVYADKETYTVGEMVHISVIPDNIGYSVEVYGPDDKLIALSTDFPIEKSGKYRIEALLSVQNETRKVSAEFNAVEAEKEISEEEKIQEETNGNDNAQEPAEPAGQTTIDETSEAQVAPEVNDVIKDEENNIVGKKLEDEKNYETFFTFVGKSGNDFIIRFYHNSTTVQPVWLETEGNMQYNLSTLAAEPNETVTLTIPLDSQKQIPTFKLHIGPESEVFEFSITIINVKSYPQVGGYWTVEFNTTGTANLTITAVEGTSFGQDLEFVELKCGDTVLDADYDGTMVFYPEYSCDQTGSERSSVLTSGDHTLLFQFGDASATAQNYATNYVCSGCADAYTSLWACMNGINKTDAGCFLNESNVVYEMNTDFSYHMPITTVADAVIKINATNVTVDCNGSSISGGQKGYGIFSSNFSNFTIKNCWISNFSRGIYISNASYVNISSSTIFNNTEYGIYLENLTSSVITNSTISNSSVGIQFNGSSNNTISNSKASNNSLYGFYLFRSVNNTIINSFAFNNSRDGIYLYSGSDSNILKNNTVSNNTANGIFIYYNCGNSTLLGNRLDNNKEKGINLNYTANITLVNNTINSSSQHGIYLYGSNNTNMTGNTISNTASGYYDIFINGSNNNVWLNNLYTYGVNDTQGANTTFCIENEGNFYEDNIDVSRIGNGTGANGTTIGGDCGLANLTYPGGSEMLIAATNVITWKKQSSQNTINYSLYYSNNTGINWHFLTATTTLSYNWTTRTKNESSDYKLKIVPFDGIYNAINDSSSFTLNMNEWVCSNETRCEYPNITSALLYENNTNSTITLMDAGIYTLIGTGTYNISPPNNYAAIKVNATGAKLDCNYGKIIGSFTGYGILIDGFNNINITGCYVYNYSYGIVVNNSDSSYVQHNLIDNSIISDLNLTSSSSNSKVSHNNFYSKGVNNSGTSNSFCVWDYLYNIIPIAAYGNLYEEKINRSYIENTLNDCGLLNVTTPQEHVNYTNSINLAWSTQSTAIGTANVSLSYSGNYGLSWTYINSTSSGSYLWDISALASGNNYLINMRPYDILHNATNATSYYFGIDNTLPSLFIINQTNSSNAVLTSSNPLKSGSSLTINVNSSDTYGINSVWADFWSNGANSTSIWKTPLSRVSGTVYDGVWQVSITLNETFPEWGYVNYTIYANDSTANSVFNNSNFSIVDNEYLCSDYLLCEYTTVSDALSGENNTNSTILVTGSNMHYNYTGSNGSYSLYPSYNRGAIEINASNVTVDCGGSTILGNHLAYGVFFKGFDNITLFGCRFGKHLIGLNISNSANDNFSSVWSYNNANYGMHLTNLTNGNMNFVNISNNTKEDIFMLKSNSTTIEKSNISYSLKAGINLTNSSFNIINGIKAEFNNYSAIYIGPLSISNLITNSTLINSTSSSLLTVYGSYNNITGNHFDYASEGYYALNIMKNALSNSVWLNNFYSGGALNNGTSTSFCVNVPGHLTNNVYSAASVTKSVGNYYITTINSSYAPKGTCGNLTEAFDDSEHDGYYSIIDDCDDTNIYTYPGATEYCDDFDNNCDGQVDEGLCYVTFPSSGSKGGGSSGGGVGGYAIEGKKIQQNIIENPVIILYRGDTVSFAIKGTEQSVKLNKVYEDKVNVSMPSLSKDFIFRLNESMMFDIDKDGTNDFEISLSSINGVAAVFNVKETTIEVKPESVKTPEEVIKEEEARKQAEEAKKPAEETPSKLSMISLGKRAFESIKSALKYIILISIALAVLISVAAGAVSYSRFMGDVKRAEEYVGKALESRVPEAEIRQKLIESGWEPEIVDSIMKMEMKMAEEKQIKENIEEEAKEGADREKIKEDLMDKGRRETEINEVMK